MGLSLPESPLIRLSHVPEHRLMRRGLQVPHPIMATQDAPPHFGAELKVSRSLGLFGVLPELTACA